jgi:hypothetical protein
MAIIYGIKSLVNNKVYIGSSQLALDARYQRHLSAYVRYKQGKTNYTTAMEILKDKHEHYLIEELNTKCKQEIAKKELYHISNTENTVNRNKPTCCGIDSTNMVEYQRIYRQQHADKFKLYSAKYRNKKRSNSICQDNEKPKQSVDLTPVFIQVMEF